MLDDMPRRLPHLRREVTRHGAVVWYVRVGKGAPRIRLRAAPGDPAFLAQYQAAIRGEAPPRPGADAPGSLAWLVARYRESPAWRDLSHATRRQREAILRKVLTRSGDVAARTIRRADIIATRDAPGTPRNAARHLVVTLRGLFAWAVEAGHLSTSPCEGVAAPQASKPVRACSTCAHVRQTWMGEHMCGATGAYIYAERKDDGPCGFNGDMWTPTPPRVGLFVRLRRFLFANPTVRL